MSKRNIIIGSILLVLFVFTCLPFIKYAVLTFDRTLLGVINEKLPPVLTTTV